MLVLSFKIILWLIKRTVDFGQSIFKYVKHSEGFSEAYQNLVSDKFAKSRLSIPEEIIALMAKIAISDGKISQLEIEYMSDTIKTMVGGMEKSGVSQRVI